jgi:hypothetical protein
MEVASEQNRRPKRSSATNAPTPNEAVAPLRRKAQTALQPKSVECFTNLGPRGAVSTCVSSFLQEESNEESLPMARMPKVRAFHTCYYVRHGAMAESLEARARGGFV